MGTSKSLGASRQSRLARLSGPIIALAMILSIVLMPAQVATAQQASLSVTPLTWNVIGLDSNNVNVGPNQFSVRRTRVQHRQQRHLGNRHQFRLG